MGVWRGVLAGGVLVGGILLWSSLAAAEELLPQAESDEDQSIPVIQNRKYNMVHEIDLALGILPADPYYKGFTGTAAYVWHFSDNFGWEIVHADFSVNTPSKLKQEVERIALATGARSPNFPEILVMAGTRLMFKPLYGKEAFLNTQVVNMEAFLHAGPTWLYVLGVVGSQGNARDRPDIFGLDLGGGVRMHMNEWFSLRLDISEILFFLPKGVAQALQVRLGAAFNLRFDE
jgi:outer membrane beta-barrel protein